MGEDPKKADSLVEEATKKALELDADTKKYIDDQLKEHLVDAKRHIRETEAGFLTGEKEKQAAANEAAANIGSFRNFLSLIWKSKHSGRMHPLLEKFNVQEKAGAGTTGHLEMSDDSMGGFLIPEVYRMELWELAIEDEIVRRCGPTVIPMTTDSIRIPYVSDVSHVTSLYGGVIAYWTAEAAQKSGTNPTFGQMELTPHKLAGITYASNELLADSAIALEPMLKRMFAKAWAYNEDYAFLRGSGAGMPLGVLNCGCLVTVTRQSTSHLNYDDIAGMYSHMLPTSLNKAVWVINPGVIPYLITMGTKYLSSEYARILVFQPNAHMGTDWTLLGRPVYITEKLPAVFAAGDILFGDFSYYLIGDRQPITIDASTHIRFDYDETAWRFVLRVAGQCWPQTYLTLKDGSMTYSPFVQLKATS